MTDAAFTSTPRSAQVQGAVRKSPVRPSVSEARPSRPVTKDARFAYLVREAARGDRESLTKAFIDMRPSLEAFLVSRGVALQDLDDILQEVGLEVLRIRFVDPDRPDRLREWFYRVAGQRASRHYRTQQREARRRLNKWRSLDDRARAGVAEPPGPDQEPETDWLAEGLASLKESHREALWMRYFCDIPTREIAVKLGISYDVTRKRISLAYRALRSFYEANRTSEEA